MTNFDHSKFNSYFIEKACFCTIGDEWNRNNWDARNNPSGNHGLYYRTDNGNGKAILHTINGDIELLPGKIYFIPAYSVLYSEIEGKIDKYFIHFQSDSINWGLCHPIFQTCHCDANSLTAALFEMVVTNYTLKTAAAERKVRGAMDLLLAELLDFLGVEERQMERFRPVLEYINEHYHEKISVAQLAEIIGLNQMYFSTAFKAAFNISPKQFILVKRIYESQYFLAKTKLSVKEIAERVGFDNDNYFSELFSVKVGISALKYRAIVNKK